MGRDQEVTFNAFIAIKGMATDDVFSFSFTITGYRNCIDMVFRPTFIKLIAG
jgi:hypothetical protein